MKQIRFALNHDRAIQPTRATRGSAGFDLYSCEQLTISPGKRALIDVGIRADMPESVMGKIHPRSGLANKFGIDVLGGLIDSDYYNTGKSIKVILINHGTEIFNINYGDRIAQIVFSEYINGGHCAKSDRTGGFGST